MSSSKSKWEAFFVAAGVPQRLSTEYASSFSTNRMRLDMLDELNKELLRDLGVKALGDIISILRYAKEKESMYKRQSPEDDDDSPPTKKQRTQPVAKTQAKTTQAKPQQAKPVPAGPRVPPALQKTKVKTLATPSVATPQLPRATVAAKPPPQPAQLKIVTTQKVGDPSQKVQRHNMKNTTVHNASSALSTARPGRQKLSERFREYETDVKRKKLSEEEAVTDAEVKQIRFADQTVKARQVPQQIKQTITGPTLVTNTTKAADAGPKYIGVKVGDKIKLKAVPRTTQSATTSRAPQTESPEDPKTGATDASTSRRTQFTVQVPSKQPGTGPDNKATTVKQLKTVKSKPKVTVVPAQGKALNRAKPLTSIFDRLDAPSSSSTALSLLKKDEEGKKDNVFKRLGTKTDDGGGGEPKTPIAVGVVRPATTMSARLGDKHSSDSVFSRLGSQSI